MTKDKKTKPKVKKVVPEKAPFETIKFAGMDVLIKSDQKRKFFYKPKN